MLNAMNVPVFTFYHSSFWDEDCIQSLTSDSPLGFCRYYDTQVPILIRDKFSFTSSTFKELITNHLRLLMGINHRNGNALKDKVSEILNTEENKLPQLVNEITLIYYQILRDLDLGFTKGIFDIEYFINRLSKHPVEKVRWLYYSLFKVSPLYKALRN